MELEGSYFVDPRFIELHGNVTESNALDYFKAHPAYDTDCLNSQLPDVRPATLAREGRKGVFYEARRAGGDAVLIRKSYFGGGTPLLVDLFYVLDNRVFHSTNYKECVRRKLGAVAAGFHAVLAASFEGEAP